MQYLIAVDFGDTCIEIVGPFPDAEAAHNWKIDFWRIFHEEFLGNITAPLHVLVNEYDPSGSPPAPLEFLARREH